MPTQSPLQSKLNIMQIRDCIILRSLLLGTSRLERRSPSTTIRSSRRIRMEGCETLMLTRSWTWTGTTRNRKLIVMSWTKTRCFVSVVHRTAGFDSGQKQGLKERGEGASEIKEIQPREIGHASLSEPAAV